MPNPYEIIQHVHNARAVMALRLHDGTVPYKFVRKNSIWVMRDFVRSERGPNSDRIIHHLHIARGASALRLHDEAVPYNFVRDSLGGAICMRMCICTERAWAEPLQNITQFAHRAWSIGAPSA